MGRAVNRRIRRARERRQYARANWLIEDRRRRMVLAHGDDPHRSWTSWVASAPVVR